MRNILAHTGRQGGPVVVSAVATALPEDHADAAKPGWRRIWLSNRISGPVFFHPCDFAEAQKYERAAFGTSCREIISQLSSISASNGRGRTDIGSPVDCNVDLFTSYGKRISTACNEVVLSDRPDRQFGHEVSPERGDFRQGERSQRGFGHLRRGGARLFVLDARQQLQKQSTGAGNCRVRIGFQF